MASIRVLVTGAGGFIGSHLVEACVRAGYEVRALVNYNSRADFGHIERIADDVRSSIDVKQVDIRDDEGVLRCCEGVDVVLHLAALIGIPYSYFAPRSYVEVNVIGTLNVLNAARRLDLRVVHTSTSEVYGTAQYVPIDERHPVVGQSPYSASKIAADHLVESFARSFGTPVTTLRPFNTFGPRQSLRAIIPTIVAQLLDDTVAEVSIGSVDPVRDFTFVTDTARAYLHVVERDLEPGLTMNLGTGTAYSIAQVYELAQQLSGHWKPLRATEERVRPARSEVFELLSDNSLARKNLDWSPLVSFESGLEKVIDYMRAYPARRAESYHV